MKKFKLAIKIENKRFLRSKKTVNVNYRNNVNISTKLCIRN